MLGDYRVMAIIGMLGAPCGALGYVKYHHVAWFLIGGLVSLIMLVILLVDYLPYSGPLKGYLTTMLSGEE